MSLRSLMVCAERLAGRNALVVEAQQAAQTRRRGIELAPSSSAISAQDVYHVWTAEWAQSDPAGPPVARQYRDVVALRSASDEKRWHHE